MKCKETPWDVSAIMGALAVAAAGVDQGHLYTTPLLGETGDSFLMC